MKAVCKYCKETFQITKEQFELLEQSEIDTPDVCPYCIDRLNAIEEIDNEFSDADPGL